MFRVVQQQASPREFEEWHAFLSRTASDAKEVSTIALCEAAVSFGQVGGDRHLGSSELIGEKSETAGKRFSERADTLRNSRPIDDTPGGPGECGEVEGVVNRTLPIQELSYGALRVWAVFSVSSFLVSAVFSVWLGSNPLRSDEPYVPGFFFRGIDGDGQPEFEWRSLA